MSIRKFWYRFCLVAVAAIMVAGFAPKVAYGQRVHAASLLEAGIVIRDGDLYGQGCLWVASSNDQLMSNGATCNVAATKFDLYLQSDGNVTWNSELTGYPISINDIYGDLYANYNANGYEELHTVCGSGGYSTPTGFYWTFQDGVPGGYQWQTLYNSSTKHYFVNGAGDATHYGTYFDAKTETDPICG